MFSAAKSLSVCVLFVVTLVGLFAAGTAFGTLIVYEPFATGSDPSSGQYTTGNIVTQNPTVSGLTCPP